MKTYKTLWLALIFGLAVSAYAQEGADCNPVQNLTATGFDETVTLQWDAPEEYVPSEKIGYSGDYEDGVGLGCLFLAAVRWSPEQLVELGVKEGAMLSAIVISTSYDYEKTDCRISIWQGGTSMQEPGEKIYYQDEKIPIIGQKWNIVSLNESIPIDISQELRIGYDLNNGSFYAGTDSGPTAAPEYSDLVYCGDRWVTTHEYAIFVNLCLYGIITYEEVPIDQYNIYKDAQLIGSTQELSYQDEEAGMEALYCVAAKYEDGCESAQECVKVTPCNTPHNFQVTFAEYVSSGARLTWETLLGEGLFNIYRNNEKIVEEYTATEYIDYDIEPETEYTWSVTAICEEGETSPTTVSGKSPKEEVGIAQNGINNLVIYPNPTKNQLRITNYELRIKNIMLFDIFGRQVFETTETALDISYLPAGIYILHIQTDNGVTNRRIVKY